MNKQTINPYLPGWEYIPDGEPKLFDERVYIYGSHDQARGKRYCTGDYVCWSAPKDDLASWSFEGVIFRTKDDPNYADEDVLYFAPDAEQGPDGRYYLFYFSSKVEKIGVAVCDTPAGHFRYYGDVHFADGTPFTSESGYGLMFDPAIISDESGNWMYYGFAMQKRVEGFPKAGYEGGFVVKLEDDMLTICSEPVRTIPGKMAADGTTYEGHGFLEASSIRHYGNLYYLVYSSELGHELCYATSKYPDKDFVYGGTIVSNGDVGLDGRTEEDAVGYLGNNHGGMLQIDDQMYIFYHRHTHGIQYSRQGCIEPIHIAEDGSIAQVCITSQGASGRPLRAKGEYSAHIACYLRSSDGILHYSSHTHWNDRHPYISQEAEDGVASLQNQFIYNMKDGAVCGFKNLEFDGSEKILRLRVRGQFTGEIEMILDGVDTPSVTKVLVKPNDRWHWIEKEITVDSGVHGVYFKVKGEGSCDIDAFGMD